MSAALQSCEHRRGLHSEPLTAHLCQHAHEVHTVCTAVDSRGVESKVKLLPERGAVISVDELKHTLVNHVGLSAGHRRENRNPSTVPQVKANHQYLVCCVFIVQEFIDVLILKMCLKWKKASELNMHHVNYSASTLSRSASHLIEAQVVFDSGGSVKHQSLRRDHHHEAIERLHIGGKGAGQESDTRARPVKNSEHHHQSFLLLHTHW